MTKRPPGSPIKPTAQSRVLSSGRSPITPARRVALADGDARPMTDDEVRSVEAALAAHGRAPVNTAEVLDEIDEVLALETVGTPAAVVRAHLRGQMPSAPPVEAALARQGLPGLIAEREPMGPQERLDRAMAIVVRDAEDALLKAEKVFEAYAYIHANKTPPDNAKAEANHNLMMEMRHALFSDDAPADVPSVPPLSDTLAHAHARARDRVLMVPGNRRLNQMRDDLAAAQKSGSVSNWEVAMIESMIDLRDLQDVIDAMTALQDTIRENVKLALANGDSKTFKCAIGVATLAKGAETVSIVDPKLVPSQFLKTEIDKAKVGRALKVPSVVPGAVLTEGKPSLRISWDDE
jgi:hypothetical protein